MFCDQLRDLIYSLAASNDRAIETARAFAFTYYIPYGNVMGLCLFDIDGIVLAYLKIQKTSQQRPEGISWMAVVLLFFE